MPIMLEAVMRVRASRGMIDFRQILPLLTPSPGLRMSSFHGNFFVRSTDLLAMPAVPHDQGYAIEIQIEETLTQPFVVLQTAILHTTCYGERRIRVVTLALPTTSNLSEVFASADQVALATYFANKAVERSLTHKLEDSRDLLFQKLVEILQTYKSSMTAAGAGASAQLAISENLKMLPVMILGLLKNVCRSSPPLGCHSSYVKQVGIRQSAQIPPDIRAYSQSLLTSLPSQLLIPYIHPTFYSLHNMPPEVDSIFRCSCELC
jgi:protein transport protein SEC24